MRPRPNRPGSRLASDQSKLVLIIVALLVVVGAWGLSNQNKTSAADARQATNGPASHAPGSSLTGRASVIDGDTLEIQGQRIRLHGIDAPESGQMCEAEGKQYRCGQRAAVALSNFIDGRTVECEAVSTDGYRRIIATCAVAGEDIGAFMVRGGWAIAYRRYSGSYVLREREAEAARLGVWAGTFTEPERWRREQP